MGGIEERAGAVQDGGHGGVLPPDPKGEGEEGLAARLYKRQTLGLPMETLSKEHFIR